ncbi:MAG: hypothetical protein V2A71_06875 [Candidatus Eisenbacteria bacterium]
MHTKRILLFSVLLLMTPALAMGSGARLDGLGVIPDFIEDPANIFTYPVSITRYPAVITGEIGDIRYGDLGGRGFGMTMGLGEDNAYGILGVTLKECTSFGPFTFSGGDNTQFDLTWGMNFGQAAFGVRFDRSSSELSEVVDEFSLTLSPLVLWYLMETPSINSWNTMGLAFSGGFQVKENDMVEATFEYRTVDAMVEVIDTSSDPDYTWKLEDKGNPSFSFNGRGSFAIAENMTLVPMLGYSKYDASWEVTGSDPDEEEAADFTISGLRAGIGCRVDFGSFFMFGLGYSQWKAEYDYTTEDPTPDPDIVETYTLTSTSMPFLFGCMEAPVRDWLTLRFGARKNLVNEKFEVENIAGDKLEVETKNGLIPEDFFWGTMDEGRPVRAFDEPFMFSMGLGFKFGGFEIDATLNEDYPFTGMYWLSGEDEIPFGKISVTYHY